MNNLLEKAIDMTIKVHQGQLDKGGELYILHPLRVMAKVNTDTEKNHSHLA